MAISSSDIDGRGAHFQMTNAAGEAFSHKGSWRGFAVEHVTPAQRDTFSYEWQSDLHFCAYHDILLEDGEIQAGDSDGIHLKDLRNTLTYVPRGATVTGWSALAPRKNSYTAIYFDPRILREELDHRFEEIQAPSVYFLQSDVSYCMRQWAVLLAGSRRDDLYAETLGLMTVLGIHQFACKSALQRFPLSQTALRKVMDFVEVNLGNPITLSDLASVVGLSRFHFSRAFKATTGETPYKYVLNRRIERAKALLRDQTLSTEEIAAIVGFHDSGHLHKTFRAREGISLIDFRKN